MVVIALHVGVKHLQCGQKQLVMSCPLVTIITLVGDYKPDMVYMHIIINIIILFIYNIYTCCSLKLETS